MKVNTIIVYPNRKTYKKEYSVREIIGILKCMEEDEQLKDVTILINRKQIKNHGTIR